MQVSTEEHDNIPPEPGIIMLLSILKLYAESEPQAQPYLIKDGIKIIL